MPIWVLGLTWKIKWIQDFWPPGHFAPGSKGSTQGTKGPRSKSSQDFTLPRPFAPGNIHPCELFAPEEIDYQKTYLPLSDKATEITGHGILRILCFGCTEMPVLWSKWCQTKTVTRQNGDTKMPTNQNGDTTISREPERWQTEMATPKRRDGHSNTVVIVVYS